MNKNRGGLGKSRLRILFPLLASLLFVGGLSSIGSQVFATTMTTTSVVETNMDTSGASNLYVNFKAGAADSASTFTITFQPAAGFSLAASGLTVVSSATCTGFFGGGSTVAGTLSAAGASNVLTISGITGSLTSGTEYCFYISGSPVTNPSSGGNYTTTLADGSDTQTQGIDVIANDQLVVTAAISQFFTLSFGSNTDSIIGASPSTYVSSTGVTLTASTNATSGWGLWAEDNSATSPGFLHSTTTGHNINSVATGSTTDFSTVTGQEKFGITINAVTGNAAAATNYNGTSTHSIGSGISGTAFNKIASAATSGSGTAQVKELLDVASTTPNASDYQDTITIVGDGSF